MYYIISKSANEAGKRTLIGSMASREAARAAAKESDGTVKTEAEYNELVASGKVESGNTGDVKADPPAGDDPKPWDGTERRAAAPEPQPTTPAAVAKVVQHAAATVNQAAAVAAEAAALLAPATGKGASIMAMAQQIKATRPARKTIGKAEKAEPKRPATDEGTLAQAREHLLTIARPEAKKSKVQIVRELALWGNKKLQRKDVFALIKAYPTDLGIAPATISTQFQFARSGKERQHS